MFCLFLDFKKAFDTVDHTLLWKKLWDAGVRGRIFREFYNDLETCVLVNGEHSRSFSIRHGVIQGDVLSTTLFLVYVRNVTISALAYADDVTVLVETASAMRGVLKVIDT